MTHHTGGGRVGKGFRVDGWGVVKKARGVVKEPRCHGRVVVECGVGDIGDVDFRGGRWRHEGGGGCPILSPSVVGEMPRKFKERRSKSRSEVQSSRAIVSQRVLYT